MLKIKNNPMSDSSITSTQYHAYNPYTTSFRNTDEIRIAIQQQDLYVLPHDSFIYIEGENLQRSDVIEDTIDPTWNTNHAFFLFEDIRYELNGIEIDKCKNVGITTAMKGLVSIPSKTSESVKTSSFGKNDEVTTQFSYCIPLKMLFGFAEDYKKIIMNMKHELILVRSRNDANCFLGANNNFSINLTKVQWRMPHIQVDDYTKLQLLKHINDNESIKMSFRSWELYEYPTMPQNQRNIWCIKTSNNLHKPRYVVFGMQTNRNAVISKDSMAFDHCNLTEVKLYLNSECYPYENTSVNFEQGKTSLLYHAYSKFQESYYHDRTDQSDPLVTIERFNTTYPLCVFDCSRQNEAIKNSLVDIRLDIETSVNIPANTRAFCLIIHDNLVSYNPYTSIVTKNI